MHNIVDSEKNMTTYPWQKGGEYSKNRVLSICGFVKSLEILQDLSTDIKQKINKTTRVVCFGEKILTLIIHGLLYKEEGRIKRHIISPSKRTTGNCKSKNLYWSF